MVSGSFVLTDTLGATFDRIYDESYENADVVVSGRALPGEGDEERQSFPADVQRQVEELPSVAAALGSVEGNAALVGSDGDLLAPKSESFGIGVDGERNQKLNPLRLVRGQWPDAGGEIGIDAATARDEGLEIGDEIGAIAEGPRQGYAI